jgi:hypothetical protein
MLDGLTPVTTSNESSSKTYAQWAAATADGRRSATTTLDIPPPEGALLARLRRVQTSVVCALLRK